jgi:hypothetical protein
MLDERLAAVPLVSDSRRVTTGQSEQNERS